MPAKKEKSKKKWLTWGIVIIVIVIIAIGVVSIITKESNTIKPETGDVDEDVGEYTFDVTPAMTSDNSPQPYNIITENQNGDGFMAFDHGSRVWSHTGISADWITFDFGLGNEKQIEKYVITAGDAKGAPIYWALYGYNSPTDRSSDFTKVDERKDINDWGTGESKTFYMNNDASFRFYRFQVFILMDESSRLQIKEIEYMEKTS